MATGFTYGTIHLDLQGWECQTSTGLGALGMDGIGSSARHVWRPISPSLNFCNFSFKRKVNETRMYDPVMSSFLSVDRYVQDPSNSQNFNRYAYCLNNPLRFTDPSGWQCRPTPQKNNYIDYTYQYLEPRDGDIGSPYMVNYFLNGVDCSGGVGGFGGGGGSSVSYGYAVNHPQFSAEQQCSIIRNWQDNPTAMNSWMLWYAGLSDVNVHETYFGAERKTILEWECGGVSHTADFGYENVGGNRFFSQTVSNIGGDGRYMPPGYDYAGLASTGTSLVGILCGYGGLLMSMESTMHYNQHFGFWRGKNGKYYDFSFHGNQYTGGMNKYAKSLGSKFNNFGRAFGYLGTGISVLQCIDANTIDQKLEYALDATFGFLGATMPEFFGLPSTIWFFGGKQVANWYNATTITPMIENGINPGLMINQPFK